jgi:putative transposase
MLIQNNTLIQWQVIEGLPRTERVLWIDDVNTSLWAIDIYDKKAWPVLQIYEDVVLALADGRARIIPKAGDNPPLISPDDKYLKKHGERGKKNYLLILPLVQDGGLQIYDRQARGRMVAELAKLTGERKAQIYKVLRRFWQGGCTPHATLPQYYKSGQTQERQCYESKLGRPSDETKRTGKTTGRNLTAEDKEYFRRGIKEFFKTGMTADLPDTWQRTKEKYFNLGYRELSDRTLVPILPPPDQLPTLRQFKYYYYKNRNFKAEITAISGEKAYESNNRPILGDSTLKAFGPGSIYQIDATVGDIYLRCYLNRKLIIGRPVIYIVVDVFSRMIVGFAVTLEGPNWAGAKMALENAFSDKVEFCAQFGVEITGAEWPVKGRCESLVGDNGEIASYNANSLVDPLGIGIANPPPDRPDMKGIVESRFPIIRKTAIAWMPGAVRQVRKRRGKDYRLDALLDLNQFRRLMIECILHYNSRRIEKYRMSIQMISDQVEPTPIKMWSWGMQKLIGRLRQVDQEVLRTNLLPRGEATVTPEGIRFRGVHYTCERALQERWFERVKGRKNKHVEIFYEALVDRIYLRLDRGRRFEECVLTTADRRFCGLDWYELLEYFQLKKQAIKAAETNQQQAAAQFHAKANQIISEATQMNKSVLANDTRSNKAQTQGIRENRQSLKIHERKHGMHGSSSGADSNELAPVIPIRQMNKTRGMKGYIPPARPHDEIRQAREEAKNRDK